MSQPAKTPEPSIDEILASIRRSIVPDDDAAGGKPVARKSASRKPEPAALAASVPAGARGCHTDGEAARADLDAAGGHGRLQERNGGRFSLKAGGDDTDDVPGDPADVSAEAQAGIAPGDTMETTGDAPALVGPLLSARTTAAVDTAFHSLTHTMLSQNPRTLEDLVREMLKPMLKAWLDANLPDMVERLVRAEIERVSRRG
jgi:cell pole-organizing protein PopZ